MVWHKDINIQSYRIHTNMSRKAYEDRRDDYKRDDFQRSFVTAYSNDGEIRYNAIWVREAEERQRRVHSKLSEKELLDKLKSYRRSGYTPVDILPWRHNKNVYYSAVWIKDRREVEWLVDASRDDWESFHKKKRKEGYSLRDIGMLGASKLSGLRYSGIWVKDSSIRRHVRAMGLSGDDFRSELDELINQNYRVSDLDSVYVGNDIRYSFILHRPARRNRLVGNFDLPDDVEEDLEDLLEEYRTPGRDGDVGNVGFFLEHYGTGKFLAFNPDEHYFMSSTRKVILGASALQNGFEVSGRNSIELSRSDFRFDARNSGTTAAGIDYPSLTLRRLSARVSPSGLLAAMLVQSDNTAADYFYNNWAGMREMRKTLEDLGTKNFGEMVSKCGQEKNSIGSKKNYEDIHEVRCHALREWITSDGGRLNFPNSDERDILNGKNSSRTHTIWRRHIDRHYNSITPRTFGSFFRSLADEELLNRVKRGELLQHMGRSSRLFQPDGLDPSLFDTHRAKNGGTYLNRAWVVFTWDWGSRTGNYGRIRPKHGFVFLTEDHSRFDTDRRDRADALATAIFQLLLPELE
ncbi:MAG: serine hydrolase [Pseudomonadota bacterium]